MTPEYNSNDTTGYCSGEQEETDLRGFKWNWWCLLLVKW